MKKIILIPLLLWLLLFIAESVNYFLIDKKPMYFRAWEYVMNQELASYVSPFKPHITYEGRVSGDLVKMMRFTPSSDEIENQKFVVDEYGFRNKVGLLKKPITAVLLGTSFLGGARDDQDNLISSLLTEKYNLPSYNYATYSIQNYWEDSRFINQPPPYVIIVGNESEILQESWIEKLEESNIKLEVPKWNSYKEWDRANRADRELSLDFDKAIFSYYQYSLMRYYSNEIYFQLLNKLFTRSQLSRSYIASEIYDPIKDMIFFDINQYDPRLDDTNKKRIPVTIQTLTKTRDIISTRGSKLIVVIVPSKAHIHANRYKYLQNSDRAMLELSKELTANHISHISMFDALHEQAEVGNLVYYREDSHWNSLTNKLIADEISKFIADDTLEE